MADEGLMMSIPGPQVHLREANVTLGALHMGGQDNDPSRDQE